MKRINLGTAAWLAGASIALSANSDLALAQGDVREQIVVTARQRAEANFAFIVDGILHTNPSAFNREFANPQQIEVLKGSQDAIYGRSAASGVIIVTTRKPGDEMHAGIKASAGNEDSYYVSAVVDWPLAPGSLFGQLHVDYRNTDGFYNNSFHEDFLGRDDEIVDDFENYNVSGRLI